MTSKPSPVTGRNVFIGGQDPFTTGVEGRKMGAEKDDKDTVLSEYVMQYTSRKLGGFN